MTPYEASKDLLADLTSRYLIPALQAAGVPDAELYKLTFERTPKVVRAVLGHDPGCALNTDAPGSLSMTCTCGAIWRLALSKNRQTGSREQP